MRDSLFDTTKCFLILLVVLGHVLEFGNGIITESFYLFIYSFHMPLFVFISGYFTKRSSSLVEFLSRNISIIETFIVFQIFFICIRLCSGGSISWYMAAVPYWTLWYLLSLLCWRLFVMIIDPVKINGRICVLISLVLCLLAGFSNLNYLISFQRTFYFFPFFMLGYYMSVEKIDVKKYFFSCVGAGLILAIMLISCIILFQYSSSLKGLLYGSYNYFSLDGFNIYLPIFRILMIFLSVILSLSLMSLLAKVKPQDWMLTIGKKTMFFYIYHTIILVFLRYILDVPKSLPFLLFLALFVIAIVYLLSFNRISNKLLNPVTSYLRK